MVMVDGNPPRGAPFPSSSRWGKLEGQLIPQGLLTIVVTPPTVRKKCLPVTWLSLPVPLWFPGCLLLVAMAMAAVGTTPGSCGEKAAPPLKAHSWEGDLGDLTRGPFQTECVWSLMP